LLRADSCLSAFSNEIKKHNPTEVLAMATSAARDAENGEELFKLASKYQIPLEIIPGEKEATITYQGAISGLRTQGKQLLVVDIGGGSTEFIFGQEQKIQKGKSFDIGCVRLTERFIKNQPSPIDEVLAAKGYIKDVVEQVHDFQPKQFIIDEIIAVAGTPTSLAAAEIGVFDPNRIDGYQLTYESLQSWLNRLSAASVSEKIKMGIPEGRADVILIGVLILLQTLEKFNKKALTVSTRGVRYGVALEIDRRCNNIIHSS
jgi:exopolyphosphatase / guanosine-5'-triphosphate,3'-diphosphate pyrophosphatase